MLVCICFISFINQPPPYTHTHHIHIYRNRCCAAASTHPPNQPTPPPTLFLNPPTQSPPQPTQLPNQPTDPPDPSNQKFPPSGAARPQVPALRQRVTPGPEALQPPRQRQLRPHGALKKYICTTDQPHAWRIEFNLSHGFIIILLTMNKNQQPTQKQTDLRLRPRARRGGRVRGGCVRAWLCAHFHHCVTPLPCRWSIDRLVV